MPVMRRVRGTHQHFDLSCEVSQFRSREGERGRRDGTLALKARPSAPRMMKPNTLRTVQQMARLEPTTGRDMVSFGSSDDGGGRGTGCVCRAKGLFPARVAYWQGNDWLLSLVLVSSLEVYRGGERSEGQPSLARRQVDLVHLCTMLRLPRTARPWHIIARRSYSAAVRPPLSPKSTTAAPPVAVDGDCIPLSATYSIADYLPSNQPSLSRETILKLHRLAALEPPKTDKDWHQLKDLDELVAIVQAVRDVDTSILGLEEGAILDARVRAEPEPIDWSPSSSSSSSSTADAPRSIGGQELLKLAQRTEGAYYVAPMPENVRTRKRSSTGAAAADADSHLSPDEL